MPRLRSGCSCVARQRQRADELEGQVKALQARDSELQQLTQQIGSREVLDDQKLIKEEKTKPDAVRQEIRVAQQDAALLAQRSSDLQSQILVCEEAVLLENFALYEPKFNLTTRHEHKLRLDSVREGQKAMMNR